MNIIAHNIAPKSIHVNAAGARFRASIDDKGNFTLKLYDEADVYNYVEITGLKTEDVKAVFLPLLSMSS